MDIGFGSILGSLISSRGLTISVGSCGPLSGAASGDFALSLCMSLAEVRPDRLELAPVRSELVSDDPGRGTFLTGAEKDLWFSVKVSGITDPRPICPSTLCGAVLG